MRPRCRYYRPPILLKQSLMQTKKCPHLPALHGKRSKVRGIAMIEALVSLLIFTTGILGAIGLQAAMTRAQGASKHRADAAVLSSELIGSMWGDLANVANYANNAGTACAHTPCARWVTKVASSLPGGESVITADAATGVTTITITWTLPSSGKHTYATTAIIR